jgi:hypothetical protein
MLSVGKKHKILVHFYFRRIARLRLREIQREHWHVHEVGHLHRYMKSDSTKFDNMKSDSTKINSMKFDTVFFEYSYAKLT